MDYVKQHIDCNRSDRRCRAGLTLAATVAGIADVGSGMLVVGILVVAMSAFGGSANLSTNMSTIVRASLRGMIVSRRRLLVRRAKRHHYRVQVLQWQAANQQ